MSSTGYFLDVGIAHHMMGEQVGTDSSFQICTCLVSSVGVSMMGGIPIAR